jgi:transcriptional regulator with XRE-family HTH domain
MQLPETFAATCCQVIRDRRQKLGLSQEEIAKRSGLARSYICDVERGARHPSLRNVSTLARALNIATSELIAQVEMNLAARVDLSALKEHAEKNGLHSEIIRYYNERMSDGLVIGDKDGLIFFNTAAAQIIGLGQADKPAEEWPEYYGCYKEDRVTRYLPSELPLVRAMAGESIDNQPMYLKNEGLPDGREVRITARPVKGENGPVAGVIILHQV